MAGQTTRILVCCLVGFVAGAVAGVLLIPDPTGPLAGLASVLVFLAVGIGLLRSDWLRDADAGEASGAPGDR